MRFADPPPAGLPDDKLQGLTSGSVPWTKAVGHRMPQVVNFERELTRE